MRKTKEQGSSALFEQKKSQDKCDRNDSLKKKKQMNKLNNLTQVQ